MKKSIATIILLIGLALNVFAQNTATAIVPGTPRSAELQAGGKQRYTVTVTGNSLITAYVESEISTVMVLYNAAGREMATASRSENIIVDVTAGTYTIEISGRRDTTTGPYTLNVTTETAQAAAARMAAKFITAPLILPYTTTGERWLRTNETNLYRLSVYPNVTQITAYTEGDIDTVMAIYSVTGGRIASNDDSEDDLNARIDINVTAGTYYIEVSGPYMRTAGRYTLHVTTETASAEAAFKPYMDLVIARFLNASGGSADTAAVNRHEAVLQFITGRGNATRAEIEAFYRNNVRALVSQVVDEEFNKVSFSLDVPGKGSYNTVLVRDLQTGQYTLSYERPSVQNDDKTITAASLEALLTAMRNSGDFVPTAIDTVRAQAALIPAVALSDAALNETKNILVNFYIDPSPANYNLVKDWCVIYRTAISGTNNEKYIYLQRCSEDALSALNDAFKQKVVLDTNRQTRPAVLDRTQQQRLVGLR